MRATKVENIPDRKSDNEPFPINLVEHDSFTRFPQRPKAAFSRMQFLRPYLP
jgi:hypothetical protein